ncbi:sugar transferase (PEP-CTERM system associated)/exopolysaccharide biosynthesis polyprenyl glycosylphosphotransferase [Sphingomonas aerolata]|uniref:Sugar transferase (PEP-CTERM system associated)/exopolysaccharide biosynthesis polyprenyl glycosylphosphotransferase n=1 Tax=Sphingomonas aerolata TaxID=185951 RepID=A0A2T4YPA9_9SPHN|nr:TIGR03013 family XrtA/PEP-CTERM system glycosyltransferase [Sphingomonas aerolata]PTM45348.1 sugar transferase (PEP-CTERM system associated)/exopolysaccharide biosynthesis polyprenyl glycosylphosphotransferase [Sphingomonas aerolata]
MIRLFKHYVPYAVLLLGIVDAVLLVVAGEIGWVVRAHQIGMAVEPIHTRVLQLATFAAALQIALVAVGAYGVASFLSLRFAAARLAVAFSLGVIFQSLIFFLVPALTFWRSNLLYATLIAAVLLVTVRAVLGRLLGGDTFKRRIVVLGAGHRAARILALSQQPGINFVAAGFVAMGEAEAVVDGAVPRADIPNLAAHIVDLNAGEVVLALEERRNALPLKDLLRVRTTGVQVIEISTFLERETGRIDLNSVNPSWLIFSDGFASGRMLSSVFKRAFDIVASLILLAVTLPIILVTALAIKLESRGPAFYRQRRVGLYNQGFDILKLRSMRQDAEIAGKAVWAAEDDPRITRIGRFIRKVRIDELPQTWTVLRGEMSFVGPRPERPQFVDELETYLPYYAERHMVKPGITGWAQINYPYGASIEDARHKLEYDLYYAKNYSPFLDMLILLQTLRVVLWPTGAR